MTPYLHIIQIWILPSLIGLKKMTDNATSRKEVVTLVIYGMALFFLFTTSTLYHCFAFAGAKG
jgi:channel protein (hemolysin III family)